ncbi:hypothetical protein SAMN05421594_3374 [Chryseobacterium oleae]|uniref:Uncharacterized protein n=1 Tax=Chryseobacterium oleae TaxID=491207 RepID=A0A1I5A6X7_CHROL|nr:hypothetical protein [Chryseobacterium oleae]SFN58110.1 hypothetical protein SAMN05421594_3374 [Chryseobacterium oleae]
MKKYASLVSIIPCIAINAQIIIGGNNISNPYTQLELQNTDEKKALILPATNDNTTLPQYNVLQTDGYNNDPTMEGMLMYDKKAQITKVYDGSSWKQAFIPEHTATTWTRARIESASAACLSILCSSNNLPLSIPANDPQFADHLSIRHSADTFRMRQKGIYRINFNAVFGGINVGFTGTKINIAILVNGEQKAYMSANAAFISLNNYAVSADTVLFLDVNSNVNFRISIDNSAFSISGYTFGGTADSNVSFEKIL